jgi:hypothetical protein
MNVRLLAGSQSSHAPHPAHMRCLNDLGVLIYAFPHRVETRRKERQCQNTHALSASLDTHGSVTIW